MNADDGDLWFGFVRTGLECYGEELTVVKGKAMNDRQRKYIYLILFQGLA